VIDSLLVSPVEWEVNSLRTIYQRFRNWHL